MKYTYYALVLLLVSSAGALADDAKRETTTNTYDAAKFTGYSALTLSEVGSFLYLLKKVPTDNQLLLYGALCSLSAFAFQVKNDALAAHNYFQKTFPVEDKIESSSSDETQKTTAPSSQKAHVAKLTGYSVFGAITIAAGLALGFATVHSKFDSFDFSLAVLGLALFRLGINNLYSAKDHFQKVIYR